MTNGESRAGQLSRAAMNEENDAMYHYRESGLQNVWLRNGYRIVATPYGEAIEIEKVGQLHRAIARAVQARPHLSGKEFRFLRCEMNLSQEALAQMIGNSAQSVALWEKGRGAPKWADRLMRALYREHVEGNANLKEIFARAEAKVEGHPSDEAKVVRLNFVKDRSGSWRSANSPAKVA